ncbi:uncharacterized protein LOC112557949 [Pomacea canaliculata]|nr:uncharacterized protein LOC112557949 [Pomacea canaliculata]XP_025083900.1 uncharacterized protein LOC112557949 [Pomacea canaliculata]
MELLAVAVVSLSLCILDTADSEATGNDCSKVITSQDKLTARPNDRVTFKCDVMSTIAPTDIHWLHVGRGLRMGSLAEAVSLGPAEWQRLISVVHVTSDLDTGPYVCRVNGVCGWSRSDSHYIVLIDKPRVYLTPPVTVIRDPDTDASYLVITCVVDSYPSPAHVRWRTGSVLKGLPVYLDPSRSDYDFNTTVSADNATYTLTLSLLNPHELGLYFCEASNIMGTGVSQSVLVILTNDSPKIVFNTTEVPVALDETVYLPCPRSPEGSETLWTRDGKNITRKTTTLHADIMTGDTGMLIRHMRADLSGLYLCTRLWQNGTAQSASIRLSLTDGFSPPAIYPLAWKHETVTTTTTDGVTTTTATRIVSTNLRLRCHIAILRELETVAIPVFGEIKPLSFHRLQLDAVDAETERPPARV